MWNMWDPVKPKVTVGMKLWSLNVGNNARHRPQVLTPVTVAKVGRKYFTTVTTGPYVLEVEYAIDTWKQRGEYAASSKLYENEQAWLDEKEAASLCSKIGSAFEYGQNRRNLGIDALRTISKLIFGYVPVDIPEEL